MIGKDSKDTCTGVLKTTYELVQNTVQSALQMSLLGMFLFFRSLERSFSIMVDLKSQILNRMKKDSVNFAFFENTCPFRECYERYAEES